MFLCSLQLNILAQDSKIYLEKKPIDFISSGDDIVYQDWLNNYNRKRDKLAIEKYYPKSKIIIGDIKGEFIEYDPVSGIREVSIYFYKIERHRVRSQHLT
jgi:hypothetical protein